MADGTPPDAVHADTPPGDDSFLLPLFPVRGAVLFPGMQIPLHVFETRYRALVRDVTARDDPVFGLIQPQTILADKLQEPPLFRVGTLARIVHTEAHDDGRFDIVAEGQARIMIEHEKSSRGRGAAYRIAAVRVMDDGDLASAPLASIERAGLEQAARQFADQMGYRVDWDQVGGLDDQALVNGMAQVAPFDVAAKQALLETNSLSARADMLMQLVSFALRQAPHGPRVTLQ